MKFDNYNGLEDYVIIACKILDLNESNKVVCKYNTCFSENTAFCP